MDVFWLAGAPVITYDPSLKGVVSIKAGSSLILTVEIAAMPTAKVQWLLGNQDLLTMAGVSIEGDACYSRLIIKGTTAKNTGNYMIKAVNEVGSDSASFDVIIKGE